MKKVCMVCGYSIENINIKECPNCGSYFLEKIRSENKKDASSRFRLGKNY